MGVNSLPKTVTRQRRGCDSNPGPSAPESSTLTTNGNHSGGEDRMDIVEADLEDSDGVGCDGGVERGAPGAVQSVRITAGVQQALGVVRPRVACSQV